jgi:hypothetical protein
MIEPIDKTIRNQGWLPEGRVPRVRWNAAPKRQSRLSRCSRVRRVIDSRPVVTMPAQTTLGGLRRSDARLR